MWMDELLRHVADVANRNGMSALDALWEMIDRVHESLSELDTEDMDLPDDQELEG